MFIGSPFVFWRHKVSHMKVVFRIVFYLIYCFKLVLIKPAYSDYA